jgi:hypothetical protein
MHVIEHFDQHNDEATLHTLKSCLAVRIHRGGARFWLGIHGHFTIG